MKFKPKQHFASGRVAVCQQCERIGSNSWPAGWIMAHDGIYCGPCSFPDFYDENGELKPRGA